MSDPPIDHRPPRELWPELLYTLPELQYPDRLNVAAELLDRHVDEGRGDRPAVLFEGRRLTYRELQSAVDRIGKGLRALGVGPGDRVMIRLTNRPAFHATWLAVQKIGAVAVSTMPMLRARELAHVIDDAEPRVAVVAGPLMEEFVAARRQASTPVAMVSAEAGAAIDRGARVEREAAGGGEVAATLVELLAAHSPGLDPHPTGRHDPAIIAYTSGSTGRPKGACHSPCDILASADSYARYVLAPTERYDFGGHPTLAFTYGLGGLLVFPMRFGAAISLLERFTPEDLLALVVRDRVTLLFCAATSYKLLLQLPDLERRFDLESLRFAVSAGEPLPKAVYEEWTERTGVPVLDGLGTTEMFQIFVCARPDARKPGATGLAVPGYEVRILDDQLAEVPRGTPGLLAVRGPTGCRYWRRPDRQREYVRGGWNIPNDVCIQDEDGYIWYQCRNDDLIICGGYNVAGPEVEGVLLEHPAVLEAAVVASPDAVKGHVPKAFVVLKPGRDPSDALAAELQEHVKRQLAPYKYPRRVGFVASLPKTETGKIRRVELRQQEAARAVKT
jgi:2-aminobenzoate-CoA ligase